MGGSGGIISKFAIGMASSFVVVVGALASAAAVVSALSPALVVLAVAAAATGAAASVVAPVVPAGILSSMFLMARGPGMIGFCLFCAATAG